MPDDEKVQGDPESTTDETKPVETKPEVEKTKEKEQTPDEIRAENARLKEHNHKLNEENAERRKKLKQYETDEAKRLDALKTEEQRKEEERVAAVARAEKAEAALQQRETEYAIRMQALAMDFHDDDDALRPEVISAVERDEEGNIIAKSVKDALKKLAEAKPHLIDKEESAATTTKKPGTPGRPNNQPPRPKTEPELDRESLVY
jgi:hypothetical protein